MKFTKKINSLVCHFYELSNIKIGVEYFNCTLTNKTDFFLSCEEMKKNQIFNTNFDNWQPLEMT